MMRHKLKWWGIFALCSALGVAQNADAQDERYFKELFSDELKSSEDDFSHSVGKYHQIKHSDAILFDLNRDKKLESIVFLKKDAEDWVDIFDHERNKIFSYRFTPKGVGSRIHKVEIKTLSSDVLVVLFYYYEGLTKYLDFNGSGRVYLLTIDRKDLKTISMFQSQSFYEESKKQKGPYYERFYDVIVQDINGDSLKEVMIKQRKISSVFWYKGNGHWSTF